MLELAQGLSPHALAELAELGRRTVAADGGRLKLEWATLRARSGERVDDVLWRDGARLVGFLGLYAFGFPTVELAGMVEPAHRRHGIGSALLDEALRLCAERAASGCCWSCPAARPAATPWPGLGAGSWTTRSTRSYWTANLPT